MRMFRYYVELKNYLHPEEIIKVYVMGWSEAHVCSMFPEYNVITIDKTD